MTTLFPNLSCNILPFLSHFWNIYFSLDDDDDNDDDEKHVILKLMFFFHVKVTVKGDHILDLKFVRSA